MADKNNALIDELNNFIDEEWKKNTGTMRDLDPSNRREKIFGKKKDLNPFRRVTRKVENPSKSVLDYSGYKGTYRTDPPSNKDGWSSITRMK